MYMYRVPKRVRCLKCASATEFTWFNRKYEGGPIFECIICKSAAYRLHLREYSLNYQALNPNRILSNKIKSFFFALSRKLTNGA